MAENKPEMLTVRQVVARGVLPERALRRLVAEKKIPCVRSGRTQYINFQKLCAELAAGEGAVWS